MYKRQQEKNIVKSHLGEDFLSDFVEHTDEYQQCVLNNDKPRALSLKRKAFKTYTTTVFMNGAKKSRYGHLIDGLSNQYALGNDQYPRTLQAAVDVMRRQKRNKEEVKVVSKQQ